MGRKIDKRKNNHRPAKLKEEEKKRSAAIYVRGTDMGELGGIDKVRAIMRNAIQMELARKKHFEGVDDTVNIIS